jgi:hypothetical protein
MFLGLGTFIGFIGGLILLGYGIRAGIRQKRIQVKENNPSDKDHPAN